MFPFVHLRKQIYFRTNEMGGWLCDYKAMFLRLVVTEQIGLRDSLHRDFYSVDTIGK